MSHLTIHPLHLGTITSDMSTFTYLRNQGKKVTFPIFAWYITGNGTSILVDTGALPPVELAAPRPDYQQSDNQTLQAQLGLLGVRLADVETVVLTHLHWDHSMGTPYLPGASFIIQEAEMQYALDPLPVHRHIYRSLVAERREFVPTGAKVELVQGDLEIADGVELVLLPGHTPGLQAVRVETDGGSFLIAGDNVPFYENWLGDPPGLPHIPSTLHVDLVAYTRSLSRMEDLADHILPGHDPRILERTSYP